jgi:hypothetical protein
MAADMLDLSVDSEIRKKYNVENSSLPPLPQIYYNDKIQNTQNETQKSNTNFQLKTIEIEPSVINISKPKAVLKKGTKFKLKSLSQISDRTRRGTKLSFSLMSPVTTTYFTIPTNTIFYGKVIKSHSPQITGNGGLIIIELTSFNLNGKTYSLEGKVLKADSKHIFFNKIKGKRTYMSNLPKSMRWGRNYKNKMYRVTKKLAKEPYTMILCPFSFLFGTVGYAGNLMLSPIIAIKYRGNRVIINKGANFTFKLTENLNIY